VPTAAVIDSQTVRAADTVPTASSGYDGGKKIKGRKRHVAVDTGGRGGNETLPATHEAMIWTAATWQLSNRLTR
jgi:hypothetical protein